MILEIKLKDGSKVVTGGAFTFFCRFSQETGQIMVKAIISDVTGKQSVCYKIKDYPTYNVGGTIAYCEEAEGED